MGGEFSFQIVGSGRASDTVVTDLLHASGLIANGEGLVALFVKASL